MAVQIMDTGDTESSVIAPRRPFLITIRATSGTIAGDWFLYYTTDLTRDNADWQAAHDNAFSETNYNDVFDTGEGLYYKIFGGTGTNIEAHFAHLIDQAAYDEDAVLA